MVRGFSGQPKIFLLIRDCVFLLILFTYGVFKKCLWTSFYIVGFPWFCLLKQNTVISARIVHYMCVCNVYKVFRIMENLHAWSSSKPYAPHAPNNIKFKFSFALPLLHSMFTSNTVHLNINNPQKLPSLIQIWSVNSYTITASRKSDIPASGLYLLLWETAQTIRETGTRSITFLSNFSSHSFKSNP